MTSPTYDLRPCGSRSGRYLGDVARLADQVLDAGVALHDWLDRYGRFVEEKARERRRTQPEYLVEALTLGVLWCARGADAMERTNGRWDVVDRLAAHRRAGGARLRDGSNGGILSLDRPYELPDARPTTDDIDRLLAWLLASGEYDDEVARLDGWRAFLDTLWPESDALLEDLVLFARDFERRSDAVIGAYTAQVPEFLRDELPRRRSREDTIQCSRTRIEYHLSMVGAEILNRAWRAAFLRCSRKVVVMPGCMRRQDDATCRAKRSETDLRCTGCAADCAVRRTTGLARRYGAEAVAVVHGSDFSNFLRSQALASGDVGIVGIACAPGVLGAGWRAYASGLPAQCVLLDESGCLHWRAAAQPTDIDGSELLRILGGARRGAGAACVQRPGRRSAVDTFAAP